VAAAATLVIAMLYVALVVVFDLVDSHHLLYEVDAHLSDRLSSASHSGELLTPLRGLADDHDLEAAPVLLWRVDSTGHVTSLSDGAPTLPASAWSRSGRPTTATMGAGSFRLRAIYSSGYWLVAGQSLVDTEHVEGVLVAAEVIAGPVLVIAMFLGALLIGMKASGPVEQARRRQLEFTADASHELRTPLSVIEAEVDLALASPRSAPRYREALDRVGQESDRLRHIVEDLLWLARFDSEPPSPAEEPVDVATIAEICADRISVVARSRDVELSVRREGDELSCVKAPPEWIDRLTGVLVDNACRYAGAGGSVRILVSTQSNKVSLVVEDSGPGIAPEERPRLFDRFHRATAEGGGAGLGLAIADAVVRSTGGRWRVTEAVGGGARMEVTWHRFGPREPADGPAESGRDSRPNAGDLSDGPPTSREQAASLAERA